MTTSRAMIACAIACVCVGCRPDAPASAPPQPASSDAPTSAVAHPTVDVDLSPSGIGATIRGPDGAKAAAREDYVVVDADPDFHMEIHRGRIDVLAEKAEIVKRWGPGFRAFVRDDDEAVIYETELAGDQRFHFVTWGEKKGLAYHCRSDKQGAPSVDAVDRMLEGCHSIDVREHATAPS